MGSAGMRCSTGGSFPAFTMSVSIGASENFFGHFAGSVTIVGPWTSPTSPDCDRLLCAASAIALRRNSIATGLAARLASTARRDKLDFDMDVSLQRSVAGNLPVRRAACQGRSEHNCPAIDGDCLSCNKAAPVGDQPRHGAGQVRRFQRALDRLPGTDHLEASIQPITEEFRGAFGDHRAWRQRVDADVVAPSSRASPRVKPMTAAFDVV